MAADSLPSINQHYLQVQALTKIVTNEPVTQAVAQTSPDYFSLTSTPVIIFMVLMAIGGIGLLLTQAYNLKQYFMVIAISLIASAIPIGMDLSSQSTELRSQATISPVPQNVIVSDVTSSSFQVTWITSKEDIGAIRLRTSPTDNSKQRIIHEATDNPSTIHTIQATNLENNTLYYFEILAGVDWYDNQGLPLKIETLKR